MEKHNFTISITGDKQTAAQIAQSLAVLASKLDQKTLSALANVVQNEPRKVALAKQFLGI